MFDGLHGISIMRKGSTHMNRCIIPIKILGIKFPGVKCCDTTWCTQDEKSYTIHIHLLYKRIRVQCDSKMGSLQCIKELSYHEVEAAIFWCLKTGTSYRRGAPCFKLGSLLIKMLCQLYKDEDCICYRIGDDGNNSEVYWFLLCHRN